MAGKRLAQCARVVDRTIDRSAISLQTGLTVFTRRHIRRASAFAEARGVRNRMRQIGKVATPWRPEVTGKRSNK